MMACCQLPCARDLLQSTHHATNSAWVTVGAEPSLISLKSSAMQVLHALRPATHITMQRSADVGRTSGRTWRQPFSTDVSTIAIQTVSISTPSGKRLQIDIPQGTRIGDRRRLQGHGHDGGALDLEFTLSEPDDLSESQVEALNRLRDAGL